MPAALTRACSVLGCSHIAPCPLHGRRRRVAFGAKVYHSARWLNFRRRVLAERPFCEACLEAGKRPGLDCTDTTAGPSTDVHHRLDLADGGAPFDRENVEALSHGCHARVTVARQVRSR